MVLYHVPESMILSLGTGAKTSSILPPAHPQTPKLRPLFSQPRTLKPQRAGGAGPAALVVSPSRSHERPQTGPSLKRAPATSEMELYAMRPQSNQRPRTEERSSRGLGSQSMPSLPRAVTRPQSRETRPQSRGSRPMSRDTRPKSRERRPQSPSHDGEVDCHEPRYRLRHDSSMSEGGVA